MATKKLKKKATKNRTTAKTVTAKKKTKTAVKKSAKKPAKKITKASAPKKIRKAAKRKAPSLLKSRSNKKTVATPKTETPVTEKMTHGEDLHLIPVPGEIQELSTPDIHQIENNFHHKEEVAFHQENQRMKEAMSSRKNIKGMNSRNRGRR